MVFFLSEWLDFSVLEPRGRYVEPRPADLAPPILDYRGLTPQSGRMRMRSQILLSNRPRLHAGYDQPCILLKTTLKLACAALMNRLLKRNWMSAKPWGLAPVLNYRAASSRLEDADCLQSMKPGGE
jgi:hypothetical protein